MLWERTQVSIYNKIPEPRVQGGDYVLKHKVASSRNRVADVVWRKKTQFALRINAQVFNPTESIVAHKLIDLILTEKILVKGKQVIDLGCGSGVVGFSAILRNASEVLFTDISPHIRGIEDHPLFRECDKIQVQNILSDVPDTSYDCVLAIPPAMESKAGQSIDSSSFESGLFRPEKFYHSVISDAARVLRPEGQLVIWLRIPLESFPTFLDILASAAQWFDMEKTIVLSQGLESSICLDHEPSLLTRWMYKRQKGGVERDGLWMFLSLIRKENGD